MSGLRIIETVEFLEDSDALLVVQNGLVHVTELKVNIGNLGITESNIFMNRSENLQNIINIQKFTLNLLRLTRFGWSPKEFRGLLRTFLRTLISEQDQFGL